MLLSGEAASQLQGPRLSQTTQPTGGSAVKADGETEGVAVNLPEPDGLGLDTAEAERGIPTGVQPADCDKFFISVHEA